MRYLFLIFFLFSCSNISVIGPKKDQNIKIEPSKKIQAKIDDEYDISYFLSQRESNCIISLEIKNISKEEKRISFTIESLDFSDKKVEAFLVEKKLKPDEVLSSESRFKETVCKNLKKINFYK